MKEFYYGDGFKGLVVIAAIIHSCCSTDESFNDESCYYENRVYKSGERIPQEETCHICFCHRGRVDCSWMNCPPPPDNCEQMMLPGECNPILYVCPIPKELTNVGTSWIRRLKRISDVPPGILYDERPDCRILGVPYKTGDLVGVASHSCLECRCARNELYCSPRCCFSRLDLGDKPSAVMRALSRGSRIPERHPLDHLWKDQDLLWNS